MTTENFKDIKEWGIFIFACLLIVYFILNILFHNSATVGALSNWVFIGPLLIFPFAGFFISMHLVPGKEMPDEGDRKEVRERYNGLKASVAGFFTWLIVLALLEKVYVEMNIILSIFCGCVLFLVIYLAFEKGLT
ncbi:hypothetical protein J2128_002291 [Methanomicrobium sp. W14]|uniref:hypothetical protein n=1 Tax=Methanomicrobium sp. W14 TaxID=2817839 RepID=UPI001AEA4333|nr:hypothetical protein [Methanomicrobium sp. W14]MBP2134325.1 hypothetical protein [Methanomicrobium sp. W14]